MSRRVDCAIQVSANRRGRPSEFLWGRRRIEVREAVDDWEEAGCWWQGEEPRRVFRVAALDGILYELHYQPSSGWRLHRVAD